MEKLFAVLSWLDGKKTYLAAVLSLVVAFCGAKGYVDQETQSFLASLIALFAGSAEAATVKLGAKRK